MPSFWSSRGEQRVEHAPLEAHALGQRRLERAVDRLLRRQHRRQRHRRRSSRRPSSPRPSGSPTGTTRATRPERSASAASIMRPVRIRSIAFALPTARVSRCVPPMPGMTPSLISGWPNFALSAAMMRSHIIASSQPPPSAKPATAAITGLRARAIAIPVGGEVVDEDVDVGLVRHLLDVGAGGERLLRAGDQDAADAGIGLERVDRGDQLLDERGVERVQRLRPVEADDADAAVGFDDDGFVAHGLLMSVRQACCMA